MLSPIATAGSAAVRALFQAADPVEALLDTPDDHLPGGSVDTPPHSPPGAQLALLAAQMPAGLIAASAAPPSPAVTTSAVDGAVNEGDPTPLRLRPPGELRDFGRAAWNGVVSLADFGLQMGRGALRLYERNPDGSPDLKSLTSPILDGLRLDYETDLYRKGGFGLGAEALTQAVAPAAVLRTSRGLLAAAEAGSARFLSALSQVERQSLSYSTEVASVLSRDGQVLARQVLSESGGRLSPEVLGAMRGNTFTHNHPLGGSFSPDDVMTALAYQPSEFRAVTSTRSLSLSFDKPPAELLGTGNAKNIENFMAGEQKAIGASFRKAVAEGTIVPPTERAARNVFMSDYFMQQLASRNSWIRYSATPH